MIGIVGPGVVGLVASIAIGRQSRVVVVDVTLCAGNADVRAGQRECRLGVIERR